MVVVEVGGNSYHMDDKLIKKWDNLKDGELAKYDEDRVYVTDGQEGSGKSLFTIQQAAYIDPSIIKHGEHEDMPRICFTASQFLHAIRNTKSTKDETKVIIFDEAFRGMSSKSALSGTNKQIVQALMEARQNNLVMFIVSPTFYLLEFYPAVLRSKALFHVVKERKSRKRYVRIFGFKNKAKLYQMGVRKGWGYPRLTKNRVRFFNKYPGGADFEARYRKKKFDSLKDSMEDVEKTHRWKKQRNSMVYILHKQGKTYEEIQKLLRSTGTDISMGQMSAICTAMIELEGKKDNFGVEK